ncbi:AAA family ATPase [Listeria sp. FSL L7-1517]|uniref:AAA family ATPase n=1 Tax=Listeria immobilis TaxID=2713502 RepID=UPI00164DDB0D|nr:AAA family ATPase [Listeria immobilis]
MRLDLSNVNLFTNNEIIFDKAINFVYGKNGTGKSTITNYIKEYCGGDLDVRIFQGFDSIIGEDNKLNAVTLGKENTSINEQIKSKVSDKKKLLEEIEKKSKEIIIPENNESENLYSRFEKSKKEKDEKKQDLEKFYSQCATKIAGNNIFVENARKYRKDAFQKEIEYAKFIKEDEIKKNKDILKSESKKAKTILFPKIDFSKYQKSVNEILLSKVESKIILEELENDSKKNNFAEEGMDIHKAGEKCSFCGNLVTTERVTLLKEYFSTDEVETLKKSISEEKARVEEERESLSSLVLNIGDFYPDFLSVAEKVNEKIKGLVKIQKNFLDELMSALEQKEKNLFNADSELSLVFPTSFNDIFSEYEEIVILNNEFADNLKTKKSEARDNLRLHEVKKLIVESKFESELTRLEVLTQKESEAQINFDNEVSKINIEKDKINEIDSEIVSLKRKTKNTEKLAHNINIKLKYLVSFELIRKKVDNQEFYEIKSHLGEIRSITEISTGEKNIIAFLYFIEKLSEVLDSSEDNNKIIVFDDPMTSNDDTMQYLIIDELQKIIKKYKKNPSSGKFILLTHNTFFYLNCSYEIKNSRSGENVFEENNFYKIQRCDNYNKINKIETARQDFKTNYEALWHELVFLYTEEKPEMMLNPIRRIIETYIIFNVKEGFYKNNKLAKNLFNTNSHYFSDLEADLNGKSQEDIKNIMKKCFEDNGAVNHFNRHWKNANKNG